MPGCSDLPTNYNADGVLANSLEIRTCNDKMQVTIMFVALANRSKLPP